MTVCALMAIVAGFVCWSLETWSNEVEFPREFLRGWREGLWWAFISMTTVGYGDKNPKTLIGRIFAMVWIVTGITISGILTAMLTSATMAADTPKIPSMNGARVAVLQWRDYDALLVAYKRGIKVEIDRPTFRESLQEWYGC